MFVILRKRWPSNDSFLGRPAYITRRAVDIFLISAYAPTSAHSEDEWDAYYDSLSAALARCPPKAIAIIGSDANACIGTGEGERNDEKFDEGYEVVGRFGSTRVNNSGRRLRVLLEVEYNSRRTRGAEQYRDRV